LMASSNFMLTLKEQTPNELRIDVARRTAKYPRSIVHSRHIIQS